MLQIVFLILSYRILTFVEQASSEFNAKRLLRKQSISSLYAPGSKFILDKTITMSKVEGFLKVSPTTGAVEYLSVLCSRMISCLVIEFLSCTF